MSSRSSRTWVHLRVALRWLGREVAVFHKGRKGGVRVRVLRDVMCCVREGGSALERDLREVVDQSGGVGVVNFQLGLQGGCRGGGAGGEM